MQLNRRSHISYANPRLPPLIYFVLGADLKKKMTAPDSSKTISQETMRNLLVRPLSHTYIYCIRLTSPSRSCVYPYSMILVHRWRAVS